MFTYCIRELPSFLSFFFLSLARGTADSARPKEQTEGGSKRAETAFAMQTALLACVSPSPGLFSSSPALAAASISNIGRGGCLFVGGFRPLSPLSRGPLGNISTAIGPFSCDPLSPQEQGPRVNFLEGESVRPAHPAVLVLSYFSWGSFLSLSACLPACVWGSMSGRPEAGLPKTITSQPRHLPVIAPSHRFPRNPQPRLWASCVACLLTENLAHLRPLGGPPAGLSFFGASPDVAAAHRYLRCLRTPSRIHPIRRTDCVPSRFLVS